MTSSDADKIAVFHKIADAWKNKQWRAVADMLSPDAVLHSMMLDPVVGRETIYQRFAGMSPSNKQVTLQIERIGVINGTLFVERRDEITVDDITQSVPVVGILEFDGPLISLWREYYDRATLLKAQGKTAAAH